MPNKNVEQDKKAPKPLTFSEKVTIYKPWIQLGGLIFLLLALMITSMVTGLMVVGLIDINPQNRQSVSNMGDAVAVCDAAIKDEYQDRMQVFALDDRSSHGDEESGGYKLYYDLNMYRDASKQTGVKNYFVNCYVSAKGHVRRLDLLEDKTFVPKAIRAKGGNPIGL